MTDNRTLAKGAMIGGVPVYNNVESTTETTMPSTSFFKTEDVDGKPVIISRDNIMGIVKDCLGSILNSGSNQDTVTKVPTLNGNTLGASTAATLSSFLNVNQLATESRYPSSYFANKTTAGTYVENGDICVVNTSGSYITQLVFTASTAGGARMPMCLARISVDSGTNWSTWGILFKL